MSKEILGHIDCPTCGTANGMRITHDKNGEPFGFCESTCNQQMRIGGDKCRVRDFVARYPWAGATPDPVQATKTSAPPVTVSAPAPAPTPKKKSSAGYFDQLLGA